MVPPRAADDGSLAADRRTWGRTTMVILESMTPEYRAVLRALYFENQTIQAFAASVREPERRVARRLADALQQFASATAQAG